MAKRDDEHGLTMAQCLRDGVGATVSDDGCSSFQKSDLGRVADCDEMLRQCQRLRIIRPIP